MLASPDNVAGSGGDPRELFTAHGVAAAVEPSTSHAGGSRWGIVVARFNDRISSRLYDGAVRTLLEAGAHVEHISAVTVPGAVEIPLAAFELAETSHYAGIIALGCVIRGDTAHFDYVCDAVTRGVLRVQIDHGIPVGFGVITCDTVEQADQRSSGEAGGHNVGVDAARATIELAALVRRVRSS